MHLTGNVLENLPFPYFLIDPDFRIRSTSIQDDSSLPGRLFTSLIDPTNFSLFHTDCCEKGMATLHLMLKENPMAYRVYMVKGENQDYHLFCFPLAVESEYLKETVERVEKKLLQFNLQLIEKKEYFQKAANEINEASLSSEYMASVGRLAAGIAHEIRNPLTTVKGFIQLLKPYLTDIGKEQYADIALDEINRANDIIYEFLNAAKPQENKKSEVNLNKIIKDMAILFESEAHLKNINLSIAISESNPSVLADEKQLKQVLVNLLKNAIEAIENENKEDNGKIKISIELMNKSSFIIIEDNGPGMSKEIIDNLFIPFYSTKQKGTGIGLSISKKIIEDHGGHLHCSSAVQGTTFKIELPLLENRWLFTNNEDPTKEKCK